MRNVGDKEHFFGLNQMKFLNVQFIYFWLTLLFRLKNEEFK